MARKEGSLNKNRTKTWHLYQMEQARKSLMRKLKAAGRPGEILTPFEYWLEVMNDCEAEPGRRDAACTALAGFTYYRPQEENTADEGPEQVSFEWVYPDPAQASGDTVSPAADAMGSTSVN